MNLRRHQTLTLRLLAASAGILSAAAFAAPAQANPVDDAFIAALNNAGVNYGDPVDAKALGQSVCPILAEPGGSFNTAVASVVARAQGMSQDMAQTFTSIAISIYCPSVMADVASGNLPALPDMPGLPGS